MWLGNGKYVIQNHFENTIVMNCISSTHLRKMLRVGRTGCMPFFMISVPSQLSIISISKPCMAWQPLDREIDIYTRQSNLVSHLILFDRPQLRKRDLSQTIPSWLQGIFRCFGNSSLTYHLQNRNYINQINSTCQLFNQNSSNKINRLFLYVGKDKKDLKVSLKSTLWVVVLMFQSQNSSRPSTAAQ